MTKTEKIAYDYWQTGMTLKDIQEKHKVKHMGVQHAYEKYSRSHFADRRSKCFRSITIIYRKLEELAEREDLNRIEKIAALMSKY